MNVHELKATDPNRFEKAYTAWTTQALDYEWWDSVEEMFTEDAANLGVTVKGIEFSLSYSQGDHAGFNGGVDLFQFMQYMGLDQEYPLMAQAIKDDGSYIVVKVGRYGNQYELREATYDTEPSGVFEGLNEETWHDVLEAQWEDCDLEAIVQVEVDRLCAKLYNDLHDEAEHLTSEASFIESCECNGTDFEGEEE